MTLDTNNCSNFKPLRDKHRGMLDIVYVGIERVHKNAALSQDSRVNREDKCLTIITIFHQV